MLSISSIFGYGDGSQPPSSWKGQYSKAEMKTVWEKTQDILSMGSYSFNRNTIQLEPSISQSARNTFKRTNSIWRWFIELILGKTYATRGHQTEISVANEDALDKAVALKVQGYNPVLLNPANAYKPGGNYKKGSFAMEEDILKRSGLAYAIDPVFKKVHNFYPLKSSELLYSPLVPFFRKGRKLHYSYLPKPVPVSIITSAAIDLNSWHKADQFYQHDQQAYLKETEQRIYSQLAISASLNHDAVVLTAFGCGAFRNNPETIAKIYKKVIDLHFQGVFKKITFAIISEGRSKANFKIFQKTFG